MLCLNAEYFCLLVMSSPSDTRNETMIKRNVDGNNKKILGHLHKISYTDIRMALLTKRLR